MASKRPPILKSITKITKAATAAIAVNQRVGADALALIRRRVALISEAFFDIGVALLTLAQQRVYTAMGHKSFEQLLVAEKLMSRTTATDLMRIAERFTRQTAVELGQSKALALLQYVEATPADDVAESLARGDAAVAGKPLSKASAAELQRAARAIRLRRKPTTKQSPEERSARAAGRALQRVLGGKRKAVVDVRKRDGQWRLVVDLTVELAARLRLVR